MDNKNLQELLRVYKKDNCSADEKEFLKSLVTNKLLAERYTCESEIDQELNSISNFSNTNTMFIADAYCRRCFYQFVPCYQQLFSVTHPSIEGYYV